MSENKQFHIPPELVGNGLARVGVTIGYGFDFGKGRCSVHVSLACNQDTETVERAVDVAMHIADEYAAEGMDVVGKRLGEQ